ncbi:uncharacterized protein CELE_ZK688.12 [Caenorhabditis elegans]|uniref:Uncharacterized protein ZK688.12 n=1 Tax=Caenorhabditis elegans TaxID=6239 RepID=YO2C_CAEEL|nr:Uncharacterized protein CELE_ZK688.12 [Caenorhabditis elegans]Q27GV2.2 RecName: Full=Uncharacterized protein ZK688.12 [Caenorhabditis elegans]CCD62543.1 Uncharacterized protein CELE_ZK688.12 [Caenorhabditis elegans]|eukprot:NP_001040897.2 Uncharacterized protein CELE_ZK688.12 [Caenorhabditis elegans]
MPTGKRKGDVESTKFDLVLRPETITFENFRIGWFYTEARLVIKNPTKNRYTYKIKVTNNDMFDIRTPKGFIDPETSIEIELLHVPGILLPRNDVHHFSVYYIKCDTEAQNSHSIWTSKKSEGCKHVLIRFPNKIIRTQEMKKMEEDDMKQQKERNKLSNEKMGIRNQNMGEKK